MGVATAIRRLGGFPSAIALGGLTGLTAVALLGLASALGINIPSPDIQADYAKGVIWAVFVGATIALWPVDRDERLALGVIWLLKCCVALGFMLFFEARSEVLDAYDYFADSRHESFDWSTLGLGSGRSIVIALAWLHSHWLIESFHAAKMTFAMIGLVAVFVFYRAACIALGTRRIALLYAIALFPSVLFWSSILGKDPIALLGLAIFSYGVVGWLRTGRGRSLAIAGVGLAIASAIRLWLGPICAVPVLLVGLRAVRQWRYRFALLAVGAVIIIGLVKLLRDYFALDTLAESLQAIGAFSTAWAVGGSGRLVLTDLSNPVELIKFLPIGFVTALFRPFPGEVMNAFGLLAGLENLVIVSLVVLAVVRTRWRELRDPVIAWAILFIVLWAVAYAPISHQNLGTASRFRLQVLPTMLALIFYLGRPRGVQTLQTVREF
jgi:hypothetical protein